ncbi:MAG: HemK/PrmC family methyltransferase [Candidatus Saccharibacteria bacterium]
MTVNDWLLYATKELAGTGTPRLDALVLLGDTLNKNSAQLLAEPDRILSKGQQQRLNRLFERRKQHEPLAYIRGKCEFYGREINVSKAVLVPRPETEPMIDLLKSLPQTAQRAVVDVGTGSGAIAVTVACELNDVQVLATDIDPACLTIARSNARKYRVNIKFFEASLVVNVSLPNGATIVANLPYVPDEYTINQAALQEPSQAIFGGQDGLDLYRHLFEQLKVKKHRGYVLTEAMPFQHEDLEIIANKHYYKLEARDDFIQVFKN